MSTIGQTITALPDAFCALYDDADAHIFHKHLGEWSQDPWLEKLARKVEQRALEGRLAPADVGAAASGTPRSEAMRYARLRGLDRAFSHINPVSAMGASIPPGMIDLAIEVAATRRFDSGAQGGALLPKVLDSPRHGQFATELRDAFAAVVRVPQQSWQACRIYLPPEHSLIHRDAVDRGLRIACAPLIADAREMSFEVHQGLAGSRFYTIKPRGLRATVKRVSGVLEALCKANVRIAVAPELTLSDGLLDAWQEALSHRKGDVGQLQWLLVGTGNLLDGPAQVPAQTGGQASASPARNTAILLDARTGEEIARQSKIYPFNFTSELLDRWRLQGRLGTEPIDEHLDPGSHLTIVEGGALRIGILVCEDLKHVIDCAGHMRSFGVSHIFCPVFGRPIKDRRWERNYAEVYSGASGSTVIVSNSRVMHRILRTDGGTGIVIRPGDAALLHARAANRIACFTLRPDGGVSID